MTNRLFLSVSLHIQWHGLMDVGHSMTEYQDPVYMLYVINMFRDMQDPVFML